MDLSASGKISHSDASDYLCRIARRWRKEFSAGQLPSHQQLSTYLQYWHNFDKMRKKLIPLSQLLFLYHMEDPNRKLLLTLV